MLFNLCCQPTWAGALIGAGTAMMLGRYDYLQPYLLGAATMLVALLFWLAYRPRPEGISAACWQVKRFRLRLLAWGTAIVLAVFIAVAVSAPIEPGL
jgi:hypothetical protein